MVAHAQAAGRWRVLVTVMIAYSVSMMALSPVSAIMPALAGAWNADVGLGTWILNAYLLTMIGAMLPAGRLGDRYGHSYIFRVGLVSYTILSLACGLATSFPALLFFRGLQGIASALVLGNSMAIVSVVFPPEQKGRAIAGVTLSANIGSSLGTFLGTLLVVYSWRWAFWMVVPLSLVAIAGSWTMRDDTERLKRSGSVDWAGAVLLFLTLTAFSLGLNHVHDGEESFQDGWSWHLPMHAITAVLLLLFLRVQKRAPEPIMPLHLFRHRGFNLALASNTVLHLTMLGAMYIVPFMLQRGQGLAASYTAGVTIVLQALAVALAPVSGWLYDRGTGRYMIPGAMAILASGIFAFSLTGPSTSYPTILGLAFWMGAGMGLFLTANNSLIMHGLPEGLRGFGSGMLETTRQLGHSLGATLVAALVGAGIQAGAPWQGFRSAWLALLAISLVGLVTAWLRTSEQAPGRPAGAPAEAGATAHAPPGD